MKRFFFAPLHPPISSPPFPWTHQPPLLPLILSSTSSFFCKAVRHHIRPSSTLLSRAFAQTDLIPLFERPAIHRTSLGNLLTWRAWAQELAMSIGSKYYKADGGPDASDLLRELEWLLEDAVGDCFSPPCSTSQKTIGNWGNLKHYLNVTGDRIESLEVSDALKGSVVDLKASLEDLRLSWKQRVCERKPFQYVVGCAHWRDLVLCVREGVLIPRPETELMIDLAEAALKAEGSLSTGIWVDLGTGSGALAIALGRLLGSQGIVMGVDASDEAIHIADQNVRRYQLQEKVKVVRGSWFSPIEDKKGEITGVLSNPPYIPSEHIPSLQAEVGKYEPRLALDGGSRGMDDLIEICNGASWALRRGGYLALETNGREQAGAVAKFLHTMPGPCFHNVQVMEDFAGILRFVSAVHC